MSRTRSQVRYCKKLRTITGMQVPVSEKNFLRKKKAELGCTWLEVIYRGLGLRRMDYLNSRKNKE